MAAATLSHHSWHKALQVWQPMPRPSTLLKIVAKVVWNGKPAEMALSMASCSTWT